MAGAGIGACCYEVGPRWPRSSPDYTQEAEGERRLLDLRAAARGRLLASGLLEEKLPPAWISAPAAATSSSSAIAAPPSAGRKITGRQALLLWLERARA